VSPTAYLTERTTKSGARWVVRFRLGGRETPLVHAGSFRSKQDATRRRDFITSEIASGRNPAQSLREMQTPTIRATLAERFTEFAKSRIDVGQKAQNQYRNGGARLGDLAQLDPGEVTIADVAAWVAANKTLAPSTLRIYLGTIQQVLDHVGIDPNPARSKRVKLPARRKGEVSVPSGKEWRLILRAILPKRRLVFRLIEAEGLRISEALSLTYGDLDFAHDRLRVSSARTKGRTAGQRWLAVPPELLDEISALVPLEDRHRDRRVFAGRTDHTVRAELTRACKLAGVAHYTPHGLRHRRASLWTAHGVDAITIQTWGGWSRASMPLDVYGHVVVDTRDDEWREFWLDVYRRERLPDLESREVQVSPSDA